MPYNITTQDGITISGIPDDMPADHPSLKQRVAQIRAQTAGGGGPGDAEKPKPVVPDMPDVSPLDGMNAGDKFYAGVGKGMTDLVAGGKQRLDEAAASLEGLIPGGADASRFFGSESAADILAKTTAANAEKIKLDEPLNHSGMAVAGQVVGTAAPSALLGPMGAGASGAVSGYAQPTDGGDFLDVVKNTALGGAIGRGGQALLSGAGRIMNPQTREEVLALLREGVDLTPGQIAGGWLSRLEEKAQSIPLMGDAILAAKQRGSGQLNTAVANRALAPVGEAAPAGVTGRELVQHVRDVLGARYDALLPRLTTQADAQFMQDMVRLRNGVAQGAIDPQAANMFARVIQGDLLGKFQGQGAITGQTLKQIESDLGARAATLAQSTDADQRLIADALREAQDTLRRLVQRTNPQYADELAQINTGWANFKRLEKAAGYVGAEDGVFNANQLQSAVRALDRSKDKGRFARGQSLMQDLSDNAKAVMGGKVPDSGTAGRTGLAALLGIGATGALNPVIPASILAGTAAYSRPVQQLTQRAMTQRPQAVRLTAEELSRLAPLARALLGGMAAPAASQ